MNINYHVPCEYTVTVHFKPMDTPVYTASETRSVEFIVEGEVQRDATYERAHREAVEQGVISQYSIHDHWEPYTIDIRADSPPPELAELYGA